MTRPEESFRARLVSAAELGEWREAHGGSPDHAARAVATAQRGCITSRQLAAIGLSRHVIRRRTQAGLLRPMLRGVHLWGGGIAPSGAAEVAAILACRGRVVLGGESAGALWGCCDPTRTVTVLQRSGGSRSRRGLVVIAAPTLPDGELTTHCGLPVTTPLRTLLDLAARGYRRLESAVSAAHASGLIGPAQLSAFVEAHAGTSGIARLRELAGLEARGFTRSQNERRLRMLCRMAGLPQPRANVRVGNWEVDFLWPEVGLALELDAFNTHGGFRQFHRDRRKQRALVAAGLSVVRVTDQMLHKEAMPLVADLAAALARLEARAARAAGPAAGRRGERTPQEAPGGAVR